MKPIKSFVDKLRGLDDAVLRYPMTAALLLAAGVVNAIAISTDRDYSKFLITFTVGALLSAVLQLAYERFFNKPDKRILLMGIAILLTAGYYLIIMPAPKLSMEIYIRTSVALFVLLIAFIWVPAIKSKNDFNKIFMITFKSFFNSLLFSGVIMGGISIIITAVNQLLFQLDAKAYPHSANIILVLFAPMYFLSLIPIYPGAADMDKAQEAIESKEENVNKAADCPRFLEILISYILIPLLSAFTIILLLYIIRNIRGMFWTNNLLEPMLVSYSISLILLYILASRLENKFAVLFRRIFPKVLVPIVIFQIAASFLIMREAGIVHTRYYVILYGIFAAASGVTLSILPVGKNGIIAAMLIVFSLISIIPPVDAFTVSRVNQTKRLENVLLKNNMLENDTIRPNKTISEVDKRIIVKAFNYLRMMEYTTKIQWLPEDMDRYADFYDTFGFNESEVPAELNKDVYINLEQPSPIDIKGYDILVESYIAVPDNKAPETICELMKSGNKYSLKKHSSEVQSYIFLVGEDDKELIRFNTIEMVDRFYNYSDGNNITPEKAAFTKENETAKITVIVRSMNINKGYSQTMYGADIYILVTIK